MKKCSLIAIAVLTFSACAQSRDITKHDPNMAIEKVVVTNGVQWIDGKTLPIEGRAFSDVDCFFDRLPRNVTTNVNAGVRAMKQLAMPKKMKSPKNALKNRMGVSSKPKKVRSACAGRRL